MRAIKKSKILEFLRYLQNSYDVYLPVRKGQDWVFDKFDLGKEAVDLRPVLTILPLKKFFLEHDETTIPQSNKPIAIVGVNCFDIEALNLLDQIMSKPYADPNYIKLRKNVLIIGVGPERINIANTGYDIFLEENEDSFLAISGSASGNKIVGSRFFFKTSESTKKILSFKDPVFQKIDKIQQGIIKSYPSSDETLRFHRSPKSKIWKKLAETCFGCGICAYVCPLCYCNEFEDSFSTSDVSGSSTSGVCDNCRQKQWDACFLPDFFAVAGHNFRENLPERIYNWYYHKFVRMPKEYGSIGCVDCGRCIEYCPAKINFKEVLKELIK